MGQVLAPHLAQFDIFELLPHAFVGVEVWRVGRQGRQMNNGGAARGQKRLPLRTPLAGCPIPDRQPRRANPAAQRAQEEQACPTGPGIGTAQRDQRPLGGAPPQDRPMLAGKHPAEERGRSARRRSVAAARQQLKRGCGTKDRRPPLTGRFFFSFGQTSVRPRVSAASSRWGARVSGFCQVQPPAFKSFRTWSLGSDTWTSRRRTAPTRWQVQNSPRNPYRAAPWANNSGKRAFSSAVSFGTAPRRGRAGSPALPSCATRFLPWLTAPLGTPKTSATSPCGQPSC